MHALRNLRTGGGEHLRALRGRLGRVAEGKRRARGGGAAEHLRAGRAVVRQAAHGAAGHDGGSDRGGDVGDDRHDGVQVQKHEDRREQVRQECENDHDHMM